MLFIIMKHIHAEVSMIPLGTNTTSLSRYIAKAIKAMKEQGIDCKVNAMGTLIESDDIDKLFNSIKHARDALFDEGVKRIEIIIRIDERRDKPKSMEEKVKAVEDQINNF